MVGIVAQTQCVRLRFRNQQTDDVTENHHQDAEMEHRARDAQQPRLIQLRRPRGPAELVVAVAARPRFTDRGDGVRVRQTGLGQR